MMWKTVDIKPADFGKYLVCSKAPLDAYYIEIGFLDGINAFSEKCIFIDTLSYEIKYATHWMPLPEPPEDE